jgi:hypothetical protein
MKASWLPLPQADVGPGAGSAAKQQAAVRAALLQLEELLCGATGELEKHQRHAGSEEDEEMEEEDGDAMEVDEQLSLSEEEGDEEGAAKRKRR